MGIYLISGMTYQMATDWTGWLYSWGRVDHYEWRSMNGFNGGRCSRGSLQSNIPPRLIWVLKRQLIGDLQPFGQSIRSVILNGPSLVWLVLREKSRLKLFPWIDHYTCTDLIVRLLARYIKDSNYCWILVSSKDPCRFPGTILNGCLMRPLMVA